VQSLVVVAKIQMSHTTLKAEVEKGYMRTAVVHGLAGHKRGGKARTRACDRVACVRKKHARHPPPHGGRRTDQRKGTRLIFLGQDWGCGYGPVNRAVLSGNANEPGDGGQVGERCSVIQVESESSLGNQRLKTKVNANNIVKFARREALVAA